MITFEEAKKALDEVKAAFEAHKKYNDERIEALKAGRGTADLDEKLAKTNAAIDKYEKLHSDFVRQNEEKMRTIEARLNRAEMGLGGGAAGAELEKLARAKAFDTFLRGGSERLSADERKVLTVATDTTGGFLAPPEYVAEIIKAVVLFSPMRELVTVRKIGTTEYQQPKRTQTAAATRVGEIATRSESQNPAWGLVKIQAPEMYAEARVSQQNLEDSAFDLEALLKDEFAEQFGVKEGQEIISGNGVNQCLGILDANAAGPATPIASTNSGSAATIAGPSGSEGDPLVTLLHAVKTEYAKNGKWVLNRASLGHVRKMKDAQGRYLWEPSLQAGLPARILEKEYVEAPDMPDQGAGAYPIAFGDWKRGYTCAERVDITMLRDPLTLASSGQVKFLARKRIGGQVVLGEALRLLKCSA